MEGGWIAAAQTQWVLAEGVLEPGKDLMVLQVLESGFDIGFPVFDIFG